MTAPAGRWIRAADWARIVSLLGLQPGTVPADVIGRQPVSGRQRGDRAAKRVPCD
jgi:hypothetical protein